MGKNSYVKQFLAKFLKQKVSNENKRLKEAYKKKQEECSLKFHENNHGQNDYFDRDDFIY